MCLSDSRSRSRSHVSRSLSHVHAEQSRSSSTEHFSSVAPLSPLAAIKMLLSRARRVTAAAVAASSSLQPFSAAHRFMHERAHVAPRPRSNPATRPSAVIALRPPRAVGQKLRHPLFPPAPLRGWALRPPPAENAAQHFFRRLGSALPIALLLADLSFLVGWTLLFDGLDAEGREERDRFIEELVSLLPRSAGEWLKRSARTAVERGWTTRRLFPRLCAAYPEAVRFLHPAADRPKSESTLAAGHAPQKTEQSDERK